MPELPEVETVRRGLNQVTLQQKITGGDVLLHRTIAYPFSDEDFLNGLEEREIISWHRRGKYLIAELSVLKEDKRTRRQGEKGKRGKGDKVSHCVAEAPSVVASGATRRETRGQGDEVENNSPPISSSLPHYPFPLPPYISLPCLPFPLPPCSSFLIPVFQSLLITSLYLFVSSTL